MEQAIVVEWGYWSYYSWYWGVEFCL